MNTTGPHVRAWQARAPMLSLPTRLPGVETAARLGVFSSAALIDFYSQLAKDDAAPARFGRRADAVRLAYTAPDATDRIAAMRSLWSDEGEDRLVALLAVSRAAAALPVAEISGEDASTLIAAMLSGGYDISAARWARAVEALLESGGAEGWALLAVGTPRPIVAVDGGRVRDYVAADRARGRMLVAGLAGLGRLGGEALATANQDANVPMQPRGKWQRAIDIAASRGEKGTVALLAAVGMQVSDWSRMPADHLYHIVAALHRVGLDSEARMIAAEAIMRS